MQLQSVPLICALLVACANQSAWIVDAAGLPTWAAKYPAPPIYEEWWVEIAKCESLPLPPQHKDVLWWLVSKRPFQLASDTTHTNVDGVAVNLTTGEDVILINYTGLFDKGLIQHEQLHKILYWKNGNKVPVPDHPDPYYKRCGMVVGGQEKLPLDSTER